MIVWPFNPGTEVAVIELLCQRKNKKRMKEKVKDPSSVELPKIISWRVCTELKSLDSWGNSNGRIFWLPAATPTTPLYGWISLAGKRSFSARTLWWFQKLDWSAAKIRRFASSSTYQKIQSDWCLMHLMSLSIVAEKRWTILHRNCALGSTVTKGRSLAFVHFIHFF